MSDIDTPTFFDEISVCSYYNFETEEECVSLFEELRTVNLPNEIENRIVDLSDDSCEEYEILFGESGPEHPSEPKNRIEINVSDNGESIHVHTYANTLKLDHVLEIYEDVIGILGEVEVKICTFELFDFYEFSRMNLPVDFESKFEPNGVRFQYEGDPHLIQKVSEDATAELSEFLDDEDDINITFVRTERHPKEVITEEDAEEFIKQKTRSIEGFLDSMKEQ